MAAPTVAGCALVALACALVFQPAAAVHGLGRSLLHVEAWNRSAPVKTYNSSNIDHLIESAVKSSNNRTIAYGQPATVMEGVKEKVRTYVAFFDAPGRYYAPQAVGIEFPNSLLSLDVLPDAQETMEALCAAQTNITKAACQQPPFPGTQTVWDFPAAGTTFNPFPQINLNWEPLGHAPQGIYTVPHFDIHFLLPEGVEALAATSAPGPCGGVSFKAYYDGNMPVPEDCFPSEEDIVNFGEIVPAMGNHYVNFENPEFNSGNFTSTFLYGGYGGKIVFYEIMITLKMLQEGPYGCTPILGTPKSTLTPGFRPTWYCIEKTANATRVELTDFVWKSGGGCQINSNNAYSPRSYHPGIPTGLPANCTYPSVTSA